MLFEMFVNPVPFQAETGFSDKFACVSSQISDLLKCPVKIIARFRMYCDGFCLLRRYLISAMSSFTLASTSSAPYTALPATAMSTPAPVTSAILPSPTPPSISIS